MNKHVFSLSLAFGAAAVGVGCMAMGIPYVFPVFPVAVALISGLGGEWGQSRQPFSGSTFFFATLFAATVGATALEGVSPGAVTQYLPSHSTTLDSSPAPQVRS